MAQFSLPNTQTGGSSTITANSLQEAQQIAQSQGTWNPGAGTYGANSILGGGSANPVGATPGAGLGPDLSGLAAFGAQTSGVTQKQLDQQKAEFDAQLQFAQQQMQQLGIPQLQINQMLANMQQQQFQSGLALAQQAQQFNQAATAAALTGYYTPPAPVPSVQQWLGGAGTTIGQTTPTGGAAGGGLPYQPGTVVRTNANQFGVVGPNGTLTAQNDQNWPQIYNQIQANQGIMTISDQQWQNALQAAAQLGAGTGGAVGAAGAAPGAPQQTLAGALQQAQLSGMYQGAPTEAAREFNQNLALQQGQLGQQYLATAAQLQGPQNTFQLSNYLRGAQGNQSVPVYLQNLANNVSTPMFQGTGTVTPTLQTAAGLANQMGGGASATPGWDYNQTLSTIQNIMGRPQTLAPGSLERLTPDELQALGSGIGAAGGTLPSFLAAYNASRLGQTAPTGMTSLA